MILMSQSKHKKILLIAVGIALFAGIVIFAFNRTPDQTTQQTTEQSEQEIASLRSFVNAANEASGIQSGAVFNYSLVSYGNPANFSIQRCRDEVRCDVVSPTPVAKFQQPNQPSPDIAEVDTTTDTVVSLHRAVPEFAGGEYPADDIERIARAFLDRVYPEFKTIEPTLTFDPGMKGARLNNGNYFFRWNHEKLELPDGLTAEVTPFIQISIAAGGFIFGYDNTIPLYQNSVANLTP